VCHTLETQRRSHRALLAAAREGRLPAARIGASVERILRLKEEYDLEKRRSADPAAAERVVGGDRFRDLERPGARRAVTVIVAGAEAVAPRLAVALREVGLRAEVLPGTEIEAGAGRTVLVALLATSEACPPDLVESWLKSGARAIVVATREPYVLAEYAQA